MTKVSIGIQARSTSTRLPKKVFEKVGHKSVLNHVIDSAFSASLYLNNWSSKSLTADVSVLIPYDDEIKGKISPDVSIIEGPEEDVLCRYVMLLNKKSPDYVCRITADCPLIPPFIISKMITLAVMNNYDYVSNVYERCRTTVDGFDCEVISKRALMHLDKAALTKEDREHVTLFFRKNTPEWARIGNVVGFLDLSHLALSVDTKEDLNRIRNEYEELEAKLTLSYDIFGKKNTHRI